LKNTLLFFILTGQAVYVCLCEGRLLNGDTQGAVGAFERFTVQGSVIRLVPVSQQAEVRNYEGMVSMSIDVNCILIKGQRRSRNTILPAVMATKEIIITNRKDGKLILAAYHSNCGGETESAKNAWQNNLSYLVPVTDLYWIASALWRYVRHRFSRQLCF